MCIAILKTQNGIITDEALENSFYSNPDGAGIAYAVNGEVHIEKGFFDCEKFIQRIREIETAHNPTMLIHCRISTSGKINKSNSHPHVINDDLCLIHNGILDIPVPIDSKKSDTRIFIKKYLVDLKPEDLKNPTVVNLISKFIGSNNKFVFLDKNGNYTICNESAGHWFNDVWYSNDTYKFSLDYGFIDEGWESYGDYYSKSVIPSDLDLLKIKKTILNLSEEDFLKIGITPMVNLISFAVISELDCYRDSVIGDKIYYLDDVDTDLYNLYMNAYDNSFKSSGSEVLL